MKRFFTVAAIIGVLISIGLPLLSTYRVIRTERVATRFSLKLRAGENFIRLRLPKGPSICQLSDADHLDNGIYPKTAGAMAAIKVSLDNIQLAQISAGDQLKFYVGDDTYKAI